MFLAGKTMNTTGKKTYSREEINNLKNQWQQSGLSKKRFAEEHGIKYYTFIGWFDGEVKQPKGFMPVQINSPEILFAEILSNGKTIRFYQPFPAEYFSLLIK